MEIYEKISGARMHTALLLPGSSREKIKQPVL